MRLKKSISDWYVCSPKADPNWIIGWWIKARNDQKHIQWKCVIDDKRPRRRQQRRRRWTHFEMSILSTLMEVALFFCSNYFPTSRNKYTRFPRLFALCAPVHYSRTQIHKENATTRTEQKSESHQTPNRTNSIWWPIQCCRPMCVCVCV